jgi:hypothetical protein
MQSVALLQKTTFVHGKENSESQQYRGDVRKREQKCQIERKEIGRTLGTVIPMTGFKLDQKILSQPARF